VLLSHSLAQLLGNAIPMLDVQSESLFEPVKQRVGLLDFETSALKLGRERKLRNHAQLSFRDVPLGKLEMFARQGSIDDGQHNPLTSEASEGSESGATPNRRECAPKVA
jgi:hypothetical protein